MMANQGTKECVLSARSLTPSSLAFQALLALPTPLANGDENEVFIPPG